MSNPMATIVETADVRVGDRISEVDTPDGPFYRVLKMNRCSLVVESATDPEVADGLSYPFTVRTSLGSSVLVAG